MKLMRISLSFIALVLSLRAGDLNKISTSYDLDFFKRSTTYGPWHLASLEYSHKFSLTGIQVRANYANRSFGAEPNAGIQFETDFWPKISKKIYGYLNMGYSPSTIFPRWRAGAELYAGLPASFEASVGIRYLHFVSSLDSATRVFIYTGSAGKYIGPFWFSLRPFFTQKPAGLSFSCLLLSRFYLKDANDYLTLSLGYGSTPEGLEPLPDTTRLNAYTVGVDGQGMLLKNLLLKGGLRYGLEEYRASNFGSKFSMSAGIGWVF